MVNVRTQFPGDWSLEQRQDARRRETEAAVALMQRRVLRRIFRLVGTNSNYGIWETDTPEDLDAALRTLPLFPYMTITVMPIIQHPVEEAVPAAVRRDPPAVTDGAGTPDGAAPYRLTYPRVYNSNDGESHFQDVAVDMIAGTYVPGLPPVHAADPRPATGLTFLRVEPGYDADWTAHPGRCLGRRRPLSRPREARSLAPRTMPTRFEIGV